MSLIANYLSKHGDLAHLRSFWDSVGTIVNRSDSFGEFPWSPDHLSRIFNHFFVLGIDDIGNTVINEGAHSLEFENRGHFKYLSVRF